MFRNIFQVAMGFWPYGHLALLQKVWKVSPHLWLSPSVPMSSSPYWLCLPLEPNSKTVFASSKLCPWAWVSVLFHNSLVMGRWLPRIWNLIFLCPRAQLWASLTYKLPLSTPDHTDSPGSPTHSRGEITKRWKPCIFCLWPKALIPRYGTHCLWHEWASVDNATQNISPCEHKFVLCSVSI